MRGKRMKVGGLLVACLLLAVACVAVPNDYNGDHKADFVYVTADGVWHQAGQPAPLFTGLSTDARVAGDYTGSGRWQPAVLRGRDWYSPVMATTIHYDPAGLPAGPPAYPTWPSPGAMGPADGILPVPADYDGTGKTLPAYYSLVDGSWWIMGHTSPVYFGIAPTAGGNLDYDVPVPADYDGDGKADIAVFRPSDSTFHILPSRGGPEEVVTMGLRSAIPVPADYNGDGKADPAVASVDGSQWFLAGSATPFATFTLPATDNYAVPAPADYDGDHKAEAALVHIPSSTTLAATLEVVAGGVISTANAPGQIYTTGLPPAVADSILRLTSYDACLKSAYWHSLYPTHCPPA